MKRMNTEVMTETQIPGEQAEFTNHSFTRPSRSLPIHEKGKGVSAVMIKEIYKSSWFANFDKVELFSHFPVALTCKENQFLTAEKTHTKRHK